MEKSNKIIMSLNSYAKNTDEFMNLSENILDELENGTEINCLVDINLYVKLKPNQHEKQIESIQINLTPKYIHVK
jgi:hypothetical protein